MTPSESFEIILGLFIKTILALALLTPSIALAQTAAPGVAVLLEGELANREALRSLVKAGFTRAGALTLDDSSVAAARAFSPTPRGQPLNDSAALELRRSLHVARLVVIDGIAMGGGAVGVHVALYEEKPTWSEFATSSEPALEADVTRLLQKSPTLGWVPPAPAVASAEPAASAGAASPAEPLPPPARPTASAPADGAPPPPPVAAAPVAPAPAAAPVAGPPRPAAAPPNSSALPPELTAAPPEAKPVRKHRPPWYFWAGAAAFVLGYLPGLVVPAFYGNYNPNQSGVAPIPLAGPFLVRRYSNDYNLKNNGWDALTFADAALQILGVAGMAAGGLVWYLGREESPEAAQPQAQLELRLTGTGAGVRLAW